MAVDGVDDDRELTGGKIEVVEEDEPNTCATGNVVEGTLNVGFSDISEDVAYTGFVDGAPGADVEEVALDDRVFEGVSDRFEEDAANVIELAPKDGAALVEGPNSPDDDPSVACVTVVAPNDGAASFVVFDPNTDVAVVVVDPKGFTGGLNAEVPDPKDARPDPNTDLPFSPSFDWSSGFTAASVGRLGGV